MNIIDLILSIFLLLGIVRGIFKGFLAELAALIALIAGIYAAIHFSHLTFDFLAIFFSWDEKVLGIIAFAITFFIVALLISLLGKVLTKTAHLLALGLVNRLLGGVFGMLKMAFLASLFFMFLESFELFHVDEETQEESILYEPVHEFAPMLLPTIIEEIKEGELFETPSEEDQEEEA
ncbi:membrane protein required for colicin V production [Salinimicrobium catena]|uniref:Membrane protein required for colicin V production n=1 Tax=Salinimicrobium catena TaxID=390640 RepID=A0A1H5J3M1_9FLAO|nr:CvpA family protein [Salinimicrobium catena]SDK83325.1 membrane protein required for colicin V production [Salinimicrobium catena]SEE46661.1 membrane protein required for colicin V production [Salinimicrobium catena]